MNSYTIYSALIKPEWAPPSSVFGPVWTALYILIAVSYVFVFYSVFKKTLPQKIVLPFVLNIIFNLAFTPIQFGLKNNILALIDILLVLGTLIWAMTTIYSRHKWVTWINVPYLLWVLFATILQATITALNW